MGRRKSTKVNVFGPYANGKRWRVVTVNPDGTRASQTYERKEDAEESIRLAREMFEEEITLMEAVDTYTEQKVRLGDMSDASAESEKYRLLSWCDPSIELSQLNAQKVAAMYEARTRSTAPGTHHRELKSWQSFSRTMLKSGTIRCDITEGIRPIGRQTHRKTQLRFSEAQALGDACLKSTDKAGATATLMALWLGMRSDEIRCRTLRDVDVAGDTVYLWIDYGKTHNAARHIVVPEPLASLLVDLKTGGGSNYLFAAKTKTGYRTKTWLLKTVRRFCKAAGVPEVCPHGLRGTWATLSSQAGIATAEVVRVLGHGSYGVTKRHYAEPGAEQRGRILRLVG